MWPFGRKTSPESDIPVVEKTASGIPAQGYLPVLGASPSAAGVAISQATAMTISTVHACVTIRAEDVARCSPKLYRSLKDGSREVVTDHPVAKLFSRPNRIQTWFEFCEQMHTGLLLRGNAYAVILRDRRGNPTELIPVNPDAVMVLEASDGSLFYNVNRVGLFQLAVLRDFKTSIPAEDIFHLRGVAFNATVGASRIGLARDSLGLALAQEQQAARWMNNGARPSGILQSPKALSKDAAQRLKDQWNQLFSGVRNTGSTAVLEDGIEWKQMSLTSADLQFLEQRKFSVTDVCRWFRMPPHKVGVVEYTSKINQIQVDQSYVNETIAPDLHRWEQKFSYVFDLEADGLIVDFDETALLRADVQTRLNIGRLGVLSGLIAPNEWRRDENLPPVDGGDEVRAPVNLAALGSNVTGTAPDGAGRPTLGNEDALAQADTGTE